jgi:hypothetical protein
LDHPSAGWTGYFRRTLDFVIGVLTKNARLFALQSASKMPAGIVDSWADKSAPLAGLR